ncbi:MAG: hypothetical protein COX77_04830 [Candidatus Komeilibacteria bacterium CG_4_10_14_0_2_um_filter_37_10]|uniref:Transcriptional regulator n=1 Tax=Candidatus Komeilibacteria bacterium CG_4_10_14_0_2_um_filter_37_10 TaxID=1974470 RepID=A0A2M7VD69_9BACT|nr:MAG: hypothetical protein COX77_04830 [Candidatus Komeilibacteria bacterium CG_4_10_14_0_2_um_filter_37_10]PJA93930.1 MAG: hypothetical protein CO133_00865 [Candidatus Komeilibacteria bacterium CG_4_9_14_3_um_filter_37_5]
MGVYKLMVEANLKNRFSRLRGQLDGLEGMLTNSRNCEDVLIQLSAIKAALNQLGVLILQKETNCLKLKDADKKKLETLLNRFVKS